MKIVTIVNPNAGRALKDPSLVSSLERILSPHGLFMVTRSLAEIPSAVENIARENPDILAICGGDGTLYHTLSPFFHLNGTQNLPLIAILKGGTTNTLLKSVGSKENPQYFARRMVDEIHGRRRFNFVEFDVMKINEGYGFFAGIAMSAKLVVAYLKGGNASIPKAVSLILKSAGSALVGGPFARELSAPVSVEGSVDGVPFPLKSVTVLFVSTTSTIGFGLKPTARGHERPGYFQLVASSRHPSFLVWQFLSALIIGSPLRGKGHAQGLFKHLELTFSQPEYYMVDGELFSSRTFNVEIGPRLKIIRW